MSGAKRKKKKKKNHGFWIVMLILWVLTLAVAACTILIPGAGDWFIDNVTPLMVASYSRLTGLAGFSVGEIMIIIAAVLIVMTVLGSIVLIFLFRREGFRKFMKGLYKTDVCIITVVCLIMSVNCVALYQGSTMDSNPDVETRQYTTTELYTLRNYIVSKCNEYSQYVTRGEDGYAIYYGDLQETAKNAMHNLAERYPRLAGYYPDVKPMMFSLLMCQADMEGYYFPFSMEANVNSMMYVVNMPEAYCHELSHLHGYILEDEANFLSFLACTGSEDPFFIYSGYMKVLNYVVNAFAPYTYTLTEEQKAEMVYSNELVNYDNIFLTPDVQAEVESRKIISSETVSEVSSTFTDTTLKMNGVSDGMASYGRVVALLLAYYDGILY